MINNNVSPLDWDAMTGGKSRNPCTNAPSEDCPDEKCESGKIWLYNMKLHMSRHGQAIQDPVKDEDVIHVVLPVPAAFVFCNVCMGVPVVMCNL